MSTKFQGRIIVEASENGGFLVMTPDGTVTPKSTERGVLAIARKWGRDHLGDASLGLTEVEWRGCGLALRVRS